MKVNNEEFCLGLVKEIKKKTNFGKVMPNSGESKLKTL